MAASNRQLRLVTDPPPAHQAAADPTRVAFEHWVFMFGRHPGRTKLDAERRAAINGALALYGLDDVLLAIEGMAAVPLSDKPAGMREAMCEITWFLASAKRVERCLAYGDQLRAMAAAPVAPPTAAESAAVDPAEVQAQRARLRALAEQLRAVRYD